jgi:hypothetical protein
MEYSWNSNLRFLPGPVNLKAKQRKSWPPLWSSGQSSWLQILRSGFDSQCYQIFWEVVGLKQTRVQLKGYLEEKVAAPVYKAENMAIGISWRGTLYPQKLALTSPASGGRLIGIICSRTWAMKFSSVFLKQKILTGGNALLRCLGSLKMNVNDEKSEFLKNTKWEFKITW